MKLIGKKVTHNKFGAGKIIAIEENKILIDFKNSTKTFLYPDSFEKFVTITDPGANEYITRELEEINRVKKSEQEQRDKEEEFKKYISSLNIKSNSHAVFGMQENVLDSVLDTWSIFAGQYMTGKHKGEPRVPKSINMNSACLLTMKPKGGREEDRFIAGIFMTVPDFIGSKCIKGIIHAHENYRIIWDPEEEDMLFWKYATDEKNMVKWGSNEMKYISNTIIQKVLEDMLRLNQNDEKQEEILNFYQYFNQLNQLPGNLQNNFD